MRLTEHFTAAEAAPEDVIVAKIQRVLAGDSKLAQIFGADRIEAIPLPDAPDFRDAPRLQVFTGAVPEEDAHPSSISKRQVSIIIRIRFDWREWEPIRSGPPTDPWPYARPSLATLENHVLTVLKAAGSLPEVLVVGEQAESLIHGSPRIGPFASTGAEQDPNGDGVVFLRDCRALYVVNVDHASGRIENIVKAEAA